MQFFYKRETIIVFHHYFLDVKSISVISKIFQLLITRVEILIEIQLSFDIKFLPPSIVVSSTKAARIILLRGSQNTSSTIEFNQLSIPIATIARVSAIIHGNRRATPLILKQGSIGGVHSRLTNRCTVDTRWMFSFMHPWDS